MGSTDVLFRREGALGHITLNRPQALNALTLPMVAAMLEQLRNWRADPDVKAVLIDSVPGRAFCAGGDVRALYESGKQGGAAARDFFRTEYRLNATIKRFPKPYVAAIGGLVMGGGVGVTVHGAFRAVSEKAVFAMPETAIGLFPDVGGTYFLPRLPGGIGMYLALTGLRLNAAEMIYAGIATHFVPEQRLGEVAGRLAAGETPDRILHALSADPGPTPLADHRPAIDRAFLRGSVEDVLTALGREGGWGEETVNLLLTRSPMSLKVTFRAMREGASLDFEDCLRMEYRIASRMVKSHDFQEGVRAAVVDKDQAPHWAPGELSGVPDAAIAPLFSQLDEDFTV